MVNNEEQFGMAVLEAMACGLPTVVTNVGGLPFVVKEGETSFVVNERSPDDLAKSLEKLVSNPSLREEMGSQAVEYVREKFHPDKVCRDLADFYESL